MIEQNIYLLPENLDQLNNLNMDLTLVLLLLIDICSNKWFFDRSLIVSIVLNCPELIKLQLEHKV